MRKVVVFDLDDTLYKELDFLKSAYRAIAADIGIPEAYDRLLAYWQKRENAFEGIIRDWHLRLTVTDLLKMYREHIPSVRLDDDTRETLEKLRKDSVLGLITDGRALTQRNKVKALGLEAYMEDGNILISEETGYTKPAKEPYLFFMEKYPGLSYYYVGDNPAKDFAAPNSLGWTTVCLLDDGRNIHPQSLEMEPPFSPAITIGKLSEL